MRNRQMIVRWLMANTKAIDVRTRDGKTYYVMVDAKAFRDGVGRLLAEVQRIKSEGDYAAATALFETYGVHFDPKLRDEVVARVERLHLPSYTGFVMPKLEPVEERRGAITDVDDLVSAGSDGADAGVLGGDARASGSSVPWSAGRFRRECAANLGVNRLAQALAERARGGTAAHRSHGVEPDTRRASTIRPICSRRSRDPRGADVRAAAVRPSWRAAGGRCRLSRGAASPCTPSASSLTASTSEAYSLLFKLLADAGRRGARAAAELSAVRAPDAARAVARAPVRSRVPRRAGASTSRASSTRSSDRTRALSARQPEQSDRLVRDARRAEAPGRAVRASAASRSSPTRCSPTTSSTRAPASSRPVARRATTALVVQPRRAVEVGRPAAGEARMDRGRPARTRSWAGARSGSS